MVDPSSSSSSSSSLTYGVFLSFRGDDTRTNFICHLHEYLERLLVKAYLDNLDLKKGDNLSNILKAIAESKISIVVFSENYATSRWCLEELVEILECRRKQEQIVMPIFYRVDPSDIRHQTKSFAKAFAEHERDPKKDKKQVQSWRDALKEAGSIAGCHSKKYQRSSSKTNHLVGMDSHIERMGLGLPLQMDKVRKVGIWGMGGIGKTTIAIKVYEQFRFEFDHFCLLHEVKDKFPNGGVSLLEKILSSLMDTDDLRIDTLNDGYNKMEALKEKKVLVVLDDVDNLSQIDPLLNGSYGGGSRIIVTTRDCEILSEFETCKVELLSDPDALKLFSQKAFGKNKPLEEYDHLSRRAVEYAQHLPLGLIVLGSHLHGRSASVWEDELKRLEKMSYSPIDNVLRRSYDGLERIEQHIFLDIACFFRGMARDSVTDILASFDFHPIIGLEVLENRALITISKYDEVEMHDSLQKMGRNIEYSAEEDGKRRRFWGEDALCALTENTASEYAEGLKFDLPKEKKISFNAEAFARMTKLRLLILTYKGRDLADQGENHLNGDLNFLSHKLRVLVWDRYPGKCLPSNFEPKYLFHIDMPYSRIERLWEGSKCAEKLKSINLSGSQYLEETPDVTEVPNLEELVLEGCTSLKVVHQSILAHKKLKHLSLHGCTALERLPSSIHMISLDTLILSDCQNLEMFPEVSEDMKAMSELNLSDTAIKVLPPSIKRLRGIQSLNIASCKSLVCLPELSSSIRYINARDCTALKAVSTPESPYNIGRCFIFSNCHLLQQKDIFGDIVKTQCPPKGDCSLPFYVSFPGSEIPEWFTYRSRGSSVTPKLPKNWFDKKFLGFAICAVTNNPHGVDVYPSAECFCTFKGDHCKYRFSFYLFNSKRLESNHILVGYVPWSESAMIKRVEVNERRYTEAKFEIELHNYRSGPCIEMCGVKFFFEEDFGEPMVEGDNSERSLEGCSVEPSGGGITRDTYDEDGQHLDLLSEVFGGTVEDDDSSNEDDDPSGMREPLESWTQVVRVTSGLRQGLLGDGFRWSRYLCGRERCGYVCYHRPGCWAKAIVPTPNDPTIFEITYSGRHTCWKTEPMLTYQVGVTPGRGIEVPSDGFRWREYDQKDIPGAMHRRVYYYVCTPQNVGGCMAIKEVQHSSDKKILKITYRGRHKCIEASDSIGEWYDSSISLYIESSDASGIHEQVVQSPSSPGANDHGGNVIRRNVVLQTGGDSIIASAAAGLAAAPAVATETTSVSVPAKKSKGEEVAELEVEKTEKKKKKNKDKDNSVLDSSDGEKSVKVKKHKDKEEAGSPQTEKSEKKKKKKNKEAEDHGADAATGNGKGDGEADKSEKKKKKKRKQEEITDSPVPVPAKKSKGEKVAELEVEKTEKKKKKDKDNGVLDSSDEEKSVKVKKHKEKEEAGSPQTEKSEKKKKKKNKEAEDHGADATTDNGKGDGDGEADKSEKKTKKCQQEEITDSPVPVPAKKSKGEEGAELEVEKTEKKKKKKKKKDKDNGVFDSSDGEKSVKVKKHKDKEEKSEKKKKKKNKEAEDHGADAATDNGKGDGEADKSEKKKKKKRKQEEITDSPVPVPAKKSKGEEVAELEVEKTEKKKKKKKDKDNGVLDSSDEEKYVKVKKHKEKKEAGSPQTEKSEKKKKKKNKEAVDHGADAATDNGKGDGEADKSEKKKKKKRKQEEITDSPVPVPAKKSKGEEVAELEVEKTEKKKKKKDRDNGVFDSSDGEKSVKVKKHKDKEEAGSPQIEKSGKKKKKKNKEAEDHGADAATDNGKGDGEADKSEKKKKKKDKSDADEE